jgi:hypothetical protein
VYTIYKKVIDWMLRKDAQELSPPHHCTPAMRMKVSVF